MSRSLALTDSRALELADSQLDLETPEIIDSKSVALCNTFSLSDCEAAIEMALAQSESHRRQSAIWDLRAGVLFQLYRKALKVNGRKFTGFWAKAEERFGVTRCTISRKMRLATTWAKEQGASPEQIRELAEAADLTDATQPAVQLVFDWIGDRTTTDLYRDYGLVNYGPQGGDLSEHRTGKRRTKAEKRFDDAAAACAHWYRWNFPAVRDTYVQPDKSWRYLEPGQLANLADVVSKLASELKAACRARKIRPAKHATWAAELEAAKLESPETAS